MEGRIQFKETRFSDVQPVEDLVLKVFDKYVAPDFSPKGRSVFQAYCHSNAIAARLADGTSFCLMATLEEKAIGVIEVRNNDHIALLFVDDRYHKKGIAKKLVSLAIEKAKPAEIDVHSSLYAVNFYSRMGFRRLGGEEERDGVRFIPMKKSITR